MNIYQKPLQNHLKQIKGATQQPKSKSPLSQQLRIGLFGHTVTVYE